MSSDKPVDDYSYDIGHRDGENSREMDYVYALGEFTDVPEELHDRPTALAEWIQERLLRLAHLEAISAPEEPK